MLEFRSVFIERGTLNGPIDLFTVVRGDVQYDVRIAHGWLYLSPCLYHPSRMSLLNYQLGHPLWMNSEGKIVEDPVYNLSNKYSDVNKLMKFISDREWMFDDPLAHYGGGLIAMKLLPQ